MNLVNVYIGRSSSYYAFRMSNERLKTFEILMVCKQLVVTAFS